MYRSHKVDNLYSSVVHVGTCGEGLAIRSSIVETIGGNEWIRYNAITGLEANLRLEGLRIDATEHLEGNIWAIE